MAAVILKDAHYVLYYLTPAIQPRMLVTFNEELSPLSVNVRVGQVRERSREREDILPYLSFVGAYCYL